MDRSNCCNWYCFKSRALDADLAEIYGYTTKAFNQQIKNNLEKFDDDFMFELSDEEVEDLRSKNLTANLSSKSRYNPHVFTEQGLSDKGKLYNSPCRRLRIPPRSVNFEWI